jgi:hypothetical protein
VATKIGRNAPCPCGSGKKYKRCCGNKSTHATSNPFSNLQRKLMNGELPFRAEIISESGESSSMKVYNAKIVTDGVETVLFDDEVTLSTNSADGDSTKNSSAAFIVPIHRDRNPEILLNGNATVSNEQPYFTIAMKDNKKQIKIKSDTGLFAIIRIATQRDAGFQYFDLLFGQKGQSEQVDETGSKMRPHIAFYPTGNGKFVRLSGFDCEIKGELGYDVKGKTVFPSSISIESNEHSETISLSFDFSKEDKIAVLTGATFVSREMA